MADLGHLSELLEGRFEIREDAFRSRKVIFCDVRSDFDEVGLGELGDNVGGYALFLLRLRTARTASLRTSSPSLSFPA